MLSEKTLVSLWRTPGYFSHNWVKSFHNSPESNFICTTVVKTVCPKALLNHAEHNMSHV